MKRKITETTEEYNESGVLLRRTIKETEEIEESTITTPINDPWTITPGWAGDKTIPMNPCSPATPTHDEWWRNPTVYCETGDNYACSDTSHQDDSTITAWNNTDGVSRMKAYMDDETGDVIISS